MNSKTLISLLLIPFIHSCESCEDSGSTASYKLTADEISLIPFTEFEKLSYFDQDGNILLGNTQPKIIENLTSGQEDESCQYIEYQEISTFLAFQPIDIAVRVWITKYDKANFLLTHYYPDSQETLRLQTDGVDSVISDNITDLTILGFDFENILVFKSLNKESDTKQILYSIENGIEFIEYRNGSYLKLSK